MSGTIDGSQGYTGFPTALDLAIANDALSRISEAPIVAFTANTPAARTLSRLYPRVRDLMLAAVDWSFATARFALIDPAESVFPWAYEYTLPTNLAKARMVLATTVLPADGVDLGPQPFEVGLSTAPGYQLRVVRCDINPATLVYTALVRDPSLWDQGFTSAFTVQLAAEIAIPITGNGQLADAMRQQAQQAISTQMGPNQTQSVVQQQRGPSTTTAARDRG